MVTFYEGVVAPWGGIYGPWSQFEERLSGQIFVSALVTSPNGGEELIAGQSETITWQIPSGISNVSIEYSDANGLSWTQIDPNTPNDGSYDWTVPQVTSNQCLVRVSDRDDAGVNDVSDDLFTIFVCRLGPDGQRIDMDDNCMINIIDFSRWALLWLTNGNPFSLGYTEPLPIMWVYIDDPGVAGHEAFAGYMSKYETTNAQYCQFLNAALASGDITVSSDDVLGANGSNGGADFVGDVYYNLAGPGSASDGATNGGAARINYSGGAFSVDSGYEDHPVTYVSWYGATGMCNYYGYRLPTEWEWQAVADYDGSYNYGCGVSINNSIANYLGSAHPDGTTVVGSFGTYGYDMADLAGNIIEWTSSCYNAGCADDFRVFRSGSWLHGSGTANVTLRTDLRNHPYVMAEIIGFRMCR